MWLTAGQYTDAFKRIKEFTGIRHALFVNSGSCKLLASALKIYYELNDGDEVITLMNFQQH